jgi:hypothetical protein
MDDIHDVTSPVVAFSMCDIFKSSTYQQIVHCFPLMILFATHMSYGFMSNPMSTKVEVNSLNHSSALCMHPYNAFNSCT